MDFIEISAKTVDDCITEACRRFTIPSNKLEYVVIEEGSSGFLGFNAKLAKINAKIKEEEISVDDTAKNFLNEVLRAMNLTAVVETKYDEKESVLDINIIGEDMGILIGKRGQTLDSLQYLVSLVINKGTKDFIRIKVDTENYRQRRKDTLENLAKNISFKVKRSKRSVSLEPMNPYERRIIHSALQGDRYVTTHSEGEEPFRRVVISIKR